MPEELPVRFPRTAKDRAPRCKTDQVDRDRANKLRAFSRAHGWAVPGTAVRWAEPLALLRRALGDGHAEIDRVLDWYTGWYAPGRRPAVRDGAEFRARWDWLRELFARHARLAPPASLSAEAEFVLGELRRYPWPPPAAAALPAVVETSLSNLRAFYRARAGTADWAEPLAAVVGASYEGYVSAWFAAVWRRYGGWAGWNADLGPHVWRPDHPEFVKALAAARG